MYGRSKYHAKKTAVLMSDGTEIVFDSKKEAERFKYLSVMEQDGDITGLQMQVKFLLIPEQREQPTTTARGKIKQGKVIERPCYYIADFVYYKDGQMVVEDSKGMRTKEYKIKRKLMLKEHGIRIMEV